MINLDCHDLFDTWRQQARWLLSHEIDPSLVSWASEGVSDLFASDVSVPEGQGPFQARIPRALLDTLEQASRYRGDQRWSLLYEVLWRVSHGDRTAMMAGDKLGSELQRRIKQVQREAHHLHAFVRFIERPPELPGPQYVAWHEPAHDILHSASEHFIGRMGRFVPCDVLRARQFWRALDETHERMQMMGFALHLLDPPLQLAAQLVAGHHCRAVAVADSPQHFIQQAPALIAPVTRCLFQGVEQHTRNPRQKRPLPFGHRPITGKQITYPF